MLCVYTCNNNSTVLFVCRPARKLKTSMKTSRMGVNFCYCWSCSQMRNWCVLMPFSLYLYSFMSRALIMYMLTILHNVEVRYLSLSLPPPPPQPREKGKMRFHKLQNVQNALDFLQKERKIKLVNIRPDEIVGGNPKLILGLTWTLILHFQVRMCIHVGIQRRC